MSQQQVNGSDGPRSLIPAGEDDVGPGLQFRPIAQMEELLDKLKLLNYETEYADFTGFRLRPINRHYFAILASTGEQFQVFASLATWLLQKSGRSIEKPQETDDPNSIIAGILDHVRQLGGAINFAPGRLKQGYGEQVVTILNRLAEETLKATKFTWSRATPQEEVTQEEPDVVDQSELLLERVEEEMAAVEEDVDDDAEEEGDADPVMRLEDLRALSASGAKFVEVSRPDDILESKTEAADWKVEMERVLPQLRVTVPPDTRDWRTHLEQMQSYKSTIGSALSGTTTQLDRLHTNVAQTLDKVASRERYLNAQLEPLLNEYRSLQDALSQAREQYRQVSGGVTERSRQLSAVSEELDMAKQEMEERGSSMTDGTPLVSIRKALAHLRAELKTMQVRVGVAEQSLLQAKLRERASMSAAASRISGVPPALHKIF